jgi:glycylpeptide N-tetradecanoyltransferase
MIKQEHQFWDKEPISKTNLLNLSNNQIKNYDINKIRTTPYDLVDNFEWSIIKDDNDIKDLFNFLNKNYVKSEELIFNYNLNFLKWYLTFPNANKDLFITVKLEDKIVGSIIGIPMSIVSFDKNIKIVTINFLCVHRKIRNKYLAPLLIKEVTRRTNLMNIWQAIFTDEVNIGEPFCISTYYHRVLNLKNAIKAKFINVSENLSYENIDDSIKRTFDINKPKYKFELLKEEYLDEAYLLYKNFVNKKKIYYNYSLEEFKHIFMSRENVTYTYVLLNENKVTDMFNFYIINNRLLKLEDKYLNIGYYSYVINNKITLEEILSDSIYYISKHNIDVVNILENHFKNINMYNLNFHKGTGNLKYYFYNWNLSKINAIDNGIILV